MYWWKVSARIIAHLHAISVMKSQWTMLTVGIEVLHTYAHLYAMYILYRRVVMRDGKKYPICVKL